MRSLASLATLLLGLAVVFWAPAAKADCPHNGDDTHQHCGGGGGAAPSNEFRFTGFTDTDDVNHTIDGGQGMLAMHALCRDDFGENARMCTSEEFWLSPNAEAPLVLNSWLHPTRVGNFSFIGIAIAHCAAWTTFSAGTAGFVIKPDGKPSIAIVEASCDIARPVT